MARRVRPHDAPHRTSTFVDMELMDRFLFVRGPRPSRLLAAVTIFACSVTSCVQWRPVAPPPATAPTASAAQRLPRWVRVTTRDSTRYLLEDATFRGDTLVGQARDDRAPSPLRRVPAADIAHLEARVPSVTGSVGVAAGVVAGVAAFAWAVGHAATH